MDTRTTTKTKTQLKDILITNPLRVASLGTRVFQQEPKNLGRALQNQRVTHSVRRQLRKVKIAALSAANAVQNALAVRK